MTLIRPNMSKDTYSISTNAEVARGLSDSAAEQPKSPQPNYSPEQASSHLEAQHSRMQLTQALVRKNINIEPAVIKMPKLNSTLNGKGRSEHSQSGGSVQQGDLIKSGTYLVLGNIKFSCEKDESRMLEIAQFINKLPISNILQQAGILSMRFGKTTGRTPGEWDSGKRVIVLDPEHPNVREYRNGDIIGTAVFEILNAASDSSRHVSEQRARNGEFERMAEATGFPAPKLYAREIEYQEFVNAMQHHNLMVQSGHANTSKDLFSGETKDFEVFFNRQVASGHSHSYEQHYNSLSPSQPDLTSEYNSWKKMIEQRKNDTDPNGEGGSAKDYYRNN